MKLSYCGDDCDRCPRYAATQSGDAGQLRAVAALWRKSGLRDTIELPEKMMCRGCTPDNTCAFGIAKCAAAKGVANCGQCGEYPCSRIQEAFKMTERYAQKCKALCTPEEFETLADAFLRKKEYLDAERRKMTQK